MKLGIIGRADRGGLGTMMSEAIRALQPDRVLLVDLKDGGRGPCDPSLIEPHAGAVWIADEHGQASYRFPQSCDMFWPGLDVVYSGETFYDQRAYGLARQFGVRLVLHTMPELLSTHQIVGVDEMWVPSSWVADQVALRRHQRGRRQPFYMPVPVAQDRFQRRLRTEARVFYADRGEAFHDRNGWEIVESAMPLVDRACVLYVRGGHPSPAGEEWRVGNVTVRWLPPVEHYSAAIPRDVDVMLMPRRYAGLSLPVQEAAYQGVAVVMSNLSPNIDWIHPDLRVPMLRFKQVEMKGGYFPVWDTDPEHLATIWNMLLDSPDRVRKASEEMMAWGDSITWERWGPAYLRAFQEIAGG